MQVCWRPGSNPGKRFQLLPRYQMLKLPQVCIYSVTIHAESACCKSQADDVLGHESRAHAFPDTTWVL